MYRFHAFITPRIVAKGEGLQAGEKKSEKSLRARRGRVSGDAQDENHIALVVGDGTADGLTPAV